MLLQLLLCLITAYVSILTFPKQFFRFVGIISSPFVRIYLKWRIAKGLEDEKRINERFGIPSQQRPTGNVIWIHAVSVGETLSVIPIMEKIREENKDISILLTTTTLTAAKLVEQRLEDKVIHQFIPFDVYKWIRRFVKYWKPSAVLFVESELWPNTLYYVHEKDIPIYLLNVRISRKSLNRMHLAKKYFKILPFSLFQAVYAPTNDLKKELKSLGAVDVVVVPNMKTISKKLPVDSENAGKIKNQISNRKVWMAVSTHPGEEEIILETHKLLKQTYPDILTVIAIRHPARANDVAELCRNEGLSVIDYLNTVSRDVIDEDVYIVNKIGCLGDFFENIKTVFVCGSLIPGIGGHNFLEPLNFNCNVATGEHIDNFRDIYLSVQEFCKMLQSPEEIATFVVESIKNNQACNFKETLHSEEKWHRIVRQILHASIKSS